MHNFWDGGLARDPVGEGFQSLGIYTAVPETELNADKVRAYTFNVNLRWVHNEIGCCMFIPWSRDQLVEIIRAITGWQTNLWELMRAGERCVTLARAFNMREGMTRADDVLPPRMQVPHVTRSLNEKPVMPEVLDEAVTLFYGMMGWDPDTGLPTAARLHELDIGWVINEL